MQTDLSTQPRRATRQLPDRVSFVVLATIVISMLAGSSAPTPLYATYAGEWHFSAITTTVVFGVYAVTVLVALLVAGRLSDHVGRRPVLLVALAFAAASMIVFEVADGVPLLMLARVLQGLATGAAAGTVGAGLLDLDQKRGQLANSIAPPLGTGGGALVAGLVVQFLPAPTHLVYLVLVAVYAAQALAVWYMRETVTPAPGALRSLVPEFVLPPAARRAVLVATPALIAAWALPSYYASLGPALARTLSGSASVLVGALPLFLLAIGAVPAIVALRNVDADRVMLLGAVGLAAGVGATLISIGAHSYPGFLVTTLLTGLGFGAAFQGSVRTVVPLALPHQRAGLLSLVYVISYLALGVPALIGGWLSARTGDVLGTALEYGAVVVVLALLAALGLARRPAPQPETGTPADTPAEAQDDACLAAAAGR